VAQQLTQLGLGVAGVEGYLVHPYALRMDARIRAEGAACAFSEHDGNLVPAPADVPLSNNETKRV
jgi:hypothetical protein